MAVATAPTKSVNYIDQLNRIANAETTAGRNFAAWADVTTDCELQATLRIIAARETSHGEVFRRRIVELGAEPCCEPYPEVLAQLKVLADPAISDADKLGPMVGGSGGADPFSKITRDIAEGRYDALTVNLFNWYIAEERDSGARLRAQCERLTAACGPMDACAEAPHPSADAEAIMSCMTEGFARLEKSLEKLARAVK
jgi:hypothetical protein